ncbi:MAG: CehA/McbA family metallohydrolase [Myxococcaceae bacterium]|nr:CehA/McbA family metallohydrolase [Myxococcaceae bacterium]
MQHARRAFVLVALSLLSCPKPGGGGGTVNPRRCELDLKAAGLVAGEGTGAKAKKVEGPADLIGGPGAQGRVGDVLLANDVVKLIIEQPGRSVGPLLSGGNLIDADLVRGANEPGRDVFGRSALFYSLGRLTSVTDVEILADGSSGGPAIVAASGKDVPHDLLNLKSLIAGVAGLPLEPVVDPSVPVPVRATTYFALSPGETRVRLVTAFCNDSDGTINLPLIELMDVGAFELFNPGGCQNGLGTSKLDDTNCLADRSRWIGTQAEGVAYGLRSLSLRDSRQPVKANAVIGYGGVVGSFVEGENLDGLLKWFDPQAIVRPGTFNILARQQKTYVRDFVIAKDLAGVGDVLSALDGVVTGTVDVSVQPGVAPSAKGARVSFVDAATGGMVALAVADDAGKARANLPPGEYRVSASREGHLVGTAVTVSVTANVTTPASVTLGDGRRLTVTAKDRSGAAVPAKVTVFCTPAPCSFNADTWRQHLLVEGFPMGAAAIGSLPPTGTLTLTLPPGQYEAVVSRGPEYSTWPDTWPARGAAIDLRTADATLEATVARILDTPGWVSADLHVHAVASPDSAVLNELRVANFLAEGVDVLLSTDHEVITDFAPVVRALNAENLIATMIGEEVTSFSHGHFNTFPLKRNPDLPNGGAFDHAGGEDGPSLRMPQLFSGIKAEHPGAVVQLNHPRGSGGVLTQLRVDTATLASHAPPQTFGMEAAPDATADDTKLFGDGFDAVESANGTNPSNAILNDWMTFLSRGTVRTATGVSDTHQAYSDVPGYARTYAKVEGDGPTTFQPGQFAEAIRTQRAYVTNGPVLAVTARKLDAAMQPIGPIVDIGGTLAVTANDAVELTVDIQGPDWLHVDRVELYSHASGRESVDGKSNSSWPEGRVLERKAIATPTIEAVPGTPLRRLHHVEKLVVRPSRDTWYVVMVRGSQPLRPFHNTPAVAYSNAILVDADGSGRYDDFPLKPGQPLRRAPPAPPAAKVPTRDELGRAIIKLLEHRHDE